MKTVMVRALAGLYLCSGFAASQIVPANVASPNARYQFSGRVLDIDTGTPIPGVRVTVQESQPNSGDLSRSADLSKSIKAPQQLILTDANGAFQVTDASAGSYFLTVERSEYRPINRSDRSSFGNVSLPAPNSASITFYLRHGGVIEGTAVDERGEGLQGSASAFKLSIVDGRWRPLHAMSTTTDREGAFRLAGLEPGHYYVAFQPQNTNHAPAVSYPPLTIYPGSRDIKGANIVSVLAGGQERVYFRLQPQQTYEVSGHSNPDWGTSGIYWTVHPSLDSGLPISPGGPTFTDQRDHSFHLTGLQKGEYTILAWKAEGVSGRTPIVVGASNVTGVVLNPIPIISLQGTVKLDVRAVRGANSMDINQTAGTSLSIEFRSDNGRNVNAQMKSNGSFWAESLEPGDYSVIVRTDNRHYLKSLRQGSRDVVRYGLHIDADSQPTPLEMEIGNGHARVEATITAPGLAESAHVWVAYMRHQGAEWIPQYQTHMQMRGIHQISFPELMLPGTHRVLATDMPPGEYIVMAWLDDNIRVDQLPYNTEEFQTQNRSYLVNLTLGEAGTTTTIEIPRLLPSTAFADFPTPPPSR